MHNNNEEKKNWQQN